MTEFRIDDDDQVPFLPVRDDPPHFVCPFCDKVTFNPNDINYRYCPCCGGPQAPKLCDHHLNAAGRQPSCGLCMAPMSLNPHPQAGKPPHYLTVGATWVCIPCTVGGREKWSKRATKAEVRLGEIEPKLHRLEAAERAVRAFLSGARFAIIDDSATANKIFADHALPLAREWAKLAGEEAP